MTRGRTSLGSLVRFAVCGLLLLWIFHRIFSNEAQLTLALSGTDWSQLTPWEQRKLSWTVGPQRLIQMSRRLDPATMVLALAQCGALVFIGGLRWRYVMKVQGLSLSIRETTRISFVAHFFNAFLLGSTGGDVLKAWYAARTTHHKKAEAVVSVFVDRLMGIFALLVFAVVLVPFNYSLIESYARYQGVSIVIVAMLIGVGGLVWIGFYSEALAHGGKIAQVFRRLPKGEILARALTSCRLFGKHRGFFPVVMGWSVLVNLLIVMTFGTISRGLGLDVGWQTLWMVVPMVVCLAALPITPSGLGVRENLLVLLLTVPAFTVKHGEALSLSLLAYLANLVWSVVGGVVYLTLPDRQALVASEPNSGVEPSESAHSERAG